MERIAEQVMPAPRDHVSAVYREVAVMPPRRGRARACR